MRKASIYMHAQLAGKLWNDEEGYHFCYNSDYLSSPTAEAISLTLPLSDKLYTNKTLHPFFDGLIPEGWLLSMAEKNWKLNSRDRMGLLLKTCRDCIGAVSVIEDEENNE